MFFCSHYFWFIRRAPIRSSLETMTGGVKLRARTCTLIEILMAKNLKLTLKATWHNSWKNFSITVSKLCHGPCPGFGSGGYGRGTQSVRVFNESKLKCAKLPAETIISFPDLALTKDSAMVATEEVRHLSSTFLVCLFETTLVVGCCLAGWKEIWGLIFVSIQSYEANPAMPEDDLGPTLGEARSINFYLMSNGALHFPATSSPCKHLSAPLCRSKKRSALHHCLRQRWE